jgi:hypothetical protein
MGLVLNGSAGKLFPNLDATARKMIDAAVAVTTGQVGLSSPAETMQRLQQREVHAVATFRRELARQIGGAIVMLDEHVDAVYDEPMPVATGDQAPHPGRPYRLWIVARLRTGTLYERLEALNQSLVQAFALIDDSRASLLIETLVLDARDACLLNGGWQGQASVPQLLASRTPSD